MLPIPFVRPESDAERAVELLDEGDALRRKRGGGFAERRLQRGVEFGAFERRDQPTAERQRHQFGWREPQTRDVAKSLHEPPDGVAVDPFSDQRIAGLFQCSEISTERAGVARGTGCEGFGQLLQRQALSRSFQLLQQDQQTHRLIVARHTRSSSFVQANFRRSVYQDGERVASIPSMPVQGEASFVPVAMPLTDDYRPLAPTSRRDRSSEPGDSCAVAAWQTHRQSMIIQSRILTVNPLHPGNCIDARDD